MGSRRRPVTNDRGRCRGGPRDRADPRWCGKDSVSIGAGVIRADGAASKICEEYGLTLDWLCRGDRLQFPHHLATDITHIEPTERKYTTNSEFFVDKIPTLIN